MSDLNGIMEFDHVIQVHADGTVTDGPAGIYAPESVITTDADGQILAADEAEYTASIERQGWQLERGLTGQYGYSGPIMHASEYVGGELEDHIRETPGLWTVVTVETLDDSEDAAGWAIAYRELDTEGN
jgi:hypothetical protein